MMATALSRHQISEVSAYVARLSIVSGESEQQDDPQRFMIARRAVDAPHIRELIPLSNAWKYALTMLNLYGNLTAAQIESYKTSLNAYSAEEVADKAMRFTGFCEDISSRTFSLASLSALHALSWSREQTLS